MPVIVAPEAFDLWLDCANVAAATAAVLIAPASDALLECYEVSPAVNRVANDDPRLVEPLAATKSDTLAAAEPRKDKKKKGDEQLSLF